jgi:hypothetical protein
MCDVLVLLDPVSSEVNLWASLRMKNVVVLIPVYKAEMDAFECYAVEHSLKVLAGQDIVFVGPRGLDMETTTRRFGSFPCMAFDDVFFASVQGYNRLLLSVDFYQSFSDYEFVLILQTDAIVIRDELSYWCKQPFDYIGAPWPDGYELFVNMGRFDGVNGKKVKVYVGNGGLSLRRVRKCVALLKEFGEEVNVFNRTGSSEDLFFSVMGALSYDFVIPNEITASRFAMELKPSFYHAVNGGLAPMGGHAWWVYEPEFWRGYLVDMPITATE